MKSILSLLSSDYFDLLANVVYFSLEQYQHHFPYHKLTFLSYIIPQDPPVSCGPRQDLHHTLLSSSQE